MMKRFFGITAVVALIFVGLALFAHSLTAQSFQMDIQLHGFAFQHSRLDEMDGTRKGCGIYTDAAQLQAGDNVRLRCGYTGARWDTNADMHYWWCRVINRRASIIKELRNREMALQRCQDRLEYEEFPQEMAYWW